MQRISLNQAEAGMVLAEPVLRPDGLPLAGPGIELTEKIIDRIRSMGVSTITIEGSLDGGEDTIAELQKVHDRLGWLFRRHTQDVFMVTLQRTVAEYLARRIAERKAAAQAKAEADKEAAAEALKAKSGETATASDAKKA